MNIAAVREQVSQAHQHEGQTGQLKQRLALQLPHLHPSIQLPEQDAQGTLARFAGAYIDQVRSCWRPPTKSPARPASNRRSNPY